MRPRTIIEVCRRGYMVGYTKTTEVGLESPKAPFSLSPKALLGWSP